MWQALARALQIAGPAALGFVSNDLINWLGSWPLVGGFFRTRKDDGSAPWYVIVIGLVGFVILVNYLFRKIFKTKLL